MGDAPDRPGAGSKDTGRAKGKRRGLFTSGVVSVTKEGRKIALFFTGRKHAGENLAAVLRERSHALAKPIQMCDALSRNPPKELAVIVANCIAHSRRKFAEVSESFPEQCRYVLEELALVYRHDADARERGLSNEERRNHHQAHSGPVVARLRAWMERELERKEVEPNSGLGQAIVYALRHWKKLTCFLDVPGAPLDNNLVERALKKAIIHRNNSLFYKTERGAEVGDIFMSLIHTCELQGVDPFDYLTEVLRHGSLPEEHPEEWMPWNYRDTIARLERE